MVTRFLKSYGLLILGSLGILGGLLLYQNYKTDVLEYSLDTVGGRLASLTPEGPNRDAVVAMYEAFKEKVLNHEVDPDQVEHVAANILNLNNSGASVTPDQAEAMLDMPVLATAARDSVSVQVAAFYEGDPAKFELLGERLKNVVDFDSQVHAMMKANPDQRAEIKHRMHYECEDGIRIALDHKVASLFPEGGFERLELKLKSLEKERMVVWKQDLAAELAVVRKRIRKDLEMVQGLEGVKLPHVFTDLRKLKVLRGLEGHDYHFDEKQIKEVIARSMDELELDMKELESDLKAMKDVLPKPQS